MYITVDLQIKWMKNGLTQDVVDPVMDEMLGKFVVDSHFNSTAKGSNLDTNNSQENTQDNNKTADPEVC